MTKNNLAGTMLIATGIIHNTVGVVLGMEPLRGMVADGLWLSMSVAGETDFMRVAIFWFLFAGFAMMMWGILLRRLESIPSLFSYTLLALCIIGVIIMPISGFWIVIPQAIFMLRQPQLTKNHATG